METVHEDPSLEPTVELRRHTFASAEQEGARAYAEALQESGERIIAEFGKMPPIAITLGSGLQNFVDALDHSQILPYAEIPFPLPAKTGHKGNLILGEYEGTPLLVLQGRVHMYENRTPAEVAFAVRTLALIGMEGLVVTNAAGGLNPDFQVRDLMVITDHINWAKSDPSTGVFSEILRERHSDMTEPYDPRFREIALSTATAHNITPQEGVYVMVPGPSFETKAEVKLFRQSGGDAVGMSTVLEVIAARQLGVRVLGFSVISNPGAGLSQNLISDDEVKREGKKAIEEYGDYFLAVLKGLHEDVSMTTDLAHATFRS